MFLSWIFQKNDVGTFPSTKTPSPSWDDTKLSQMANITTSMLGKIFGNLSTNVCSLPQAQSSTELAVYQAPVKTSNLAQAIEAVKMLWTSFQQTQEKTFIKQPASESTAVGFYKAGGSGLDRFALSWQERAPALRVSSQALQETCSLVAPKASPAQTPTSSSGALLNFMRVFSSSPNPEQTISFSDQVPKTSPGFCYNAFETTPVVQKAMSEAVNISSNASWGVPVQTTPFYKGPLASKPAFIEALASKLSRASNVSVCEIREDFYKGPLSSTAGIKEALTKALSPTPSSQVVESQSSYGKYVALGLLTLGACYYGYKKYINKDATADTKEQENFKQFQQGIAELVAGKKEVVSLAKPKAIEATVAITAIKKEAKKSFFKKIFFFFFSLARIMKSVFDLEHPFLSKSTKHLL